MRRHDFHYELDEDLIAAYPHQERSASRLLCLDPLAETLTDRQFVELPLLLAPEDLLVFNDTQVIPARLFGVKSTGGKVELLIERITGPHSALAHVRSSKSPKPGSRLTLEDGTDALVRDREGELYAIEFSSERTVSELLERYGHIPLPPYIRREDEPMDRDRYQTIYARVPGAVAAPTAGLHFDEVLMQRLEQRGVGLAFTTLHVGAGTFQPMRSENLDEHIMHRERFEVSEDVTGKIAETRRRGGRVIAVGTTVVRSLEAASRGGEIAACSGETNLFITPGYRFRSVDGLLTNFHLPESTLLMLVCAFAGYERVMHAYRHAVQNGYRFFSYGDAMFIEQRARDA